MPLPQADATTLRVPIGLVLFLSPCFIIRVMMDSYEVQSHRTHSGKHHS